MIGEEEATLTVNEANAVVDPVLQTLTGFADSTVTNAADESVIQRHCNWHMGIDDSGEPVCATVNGGWASTLDIGPEAVALMRQVRFSEFTACGEFCPVGERHALVVSDPLGANSAVHMKFDGSDIAQVHVAIDGLPARSLEVPLVCTPLP